MSRRIRSLKPEWLEDERLALASSDARVLSIALLLLADDYGRGRANPVMLAGEVFPGKIPETLANALAYLSKVRFVTLYEVDEQQYFEIRNWDKHQKVDKPGKPKVPANPHTCETRDNFRETPANPRASRASIPGPYPDPDPGPFPVSDPVAPPAPSRADPPDAKGSRAIRSLDPRAPFALTYDWDPGVGVLMGSTVPVDRYPELLASFLSYWVPEGTEHPGHRWRAKLVAWMTEQVQRAPRKAPPREALQTGVRRAAVDVALERVHELEAAQAANQATGTDGFLQLGTVTE